MYVCVTKDRWAVTAWYSCCYLVQQRDIIWQWSTDEQITWTCWTRVATRTPKLCSRSRYFYSDLLCKVNSCYENTHYSSDVLGCTEFTLLKAVLCIQHCANHFLLHIDVRYWYSNSLRLSANHFTNQIIVREDELSELGREDQPSMWEQCCFVSQLQRGMECTAWNQTACYNWHTGSCRTGKWQINSKFLIYFWSSCWWLQCIQFVG